MTSLGLAGASYWWRRWRGAGWCWLAAAGTALSAAHGQVLPPDTARIRHALAAAQLALPADTTTAGRLVRPALARSRQAGFREGEAVGLVLLGRIWAGSGRHEAAIRLYQQAERLLQAQARVQPTSRLSARLGMAANSIGVAEREQGNLKASVIACLRAIDYSTQARDYDGLVVQYHNLASCFGELGQPAQQLAYLQRSIALRRQPLRHPEQLLAPTLSLAMLLTSQHQRPGAWHCLEQARPLLALPRAAHYRASYYRARGIYFFEGGQFRQAEQSFRLALGEVAQTGNPEHAIDLYQALGRTARQLGQLAEAQATLLHGLALSRTLRNQAQEARLLEALAELEEARGPAHAPAALAYYKQLDAVKSHLEEAQTKRLLLQLETQYRTRQQQQQIRGLRAQRQAQQQDLRRKTLLTYAAFALVGVLLVAGALAYAAVRARQKLTTQQQRWQALKIQELEQERRQLATEAMLHGQETERSRIARDLHDGLGGMLSTVKYYLGTIRGQGVLPAPSAELFARSLQHLDSSIGELRRVAHDMMPEALQQFGLVPALTDLCAALSHHQQLHVQLQAYGLGERLPQRTEVIVYRIVQELLNNALKHAAARHILVQLIRADAQLQLVVEDDGAGFEPAAPGAGAGMGLRSIQARVDYLRGTFDVHSRPGQGTTATIEFPLSDV